MNEQMSLEQKITDAVWIAKTLFERGKATGSAANLSFRHEGNIYITGSGTCFGRLDRLSFSCTTLNGTHLTGILPSKELPLHQIYYEKSEEIQAVIHVHSYYAIMYSFLMHSNPADIVPDYTPYLRMKVGTVGLVPYAVPGSQELFQYFKAAAEQSDAYILSQHGPLVGGSSLMDTFYKLEELEESCKIAWTLDRGQTHS